MELSPQLLFADVMHKRLFPKENSFHYRVYYLVVDLADIESLADGRWFGVDRGGLSSFHRRDHGPCDGSSLRDWSSELIRTYASDLGINRVILVSMPRILGYGFNPVSFWLCLDGSDRLRSVISEVHNTFGERHAYFCRNEDGSPLGRNKEISADKLFHVSPFLPRNGHYTFRFSLTEGRFAVWITYYDANGAKQLLTSLSGEFREYTRSQRLRAFVSCPLVTLKTITMIHWQALKLLLKGIRYIPRPPQLARRVVLSGKPSDS